MKISTRNELLFVLKADYMMNRGKFKPSLKDKIKDLLLPDYIMRYMKQMRMASYYNNGGGILSKPKYLWHYRKFRKLGIKLGFSIGHDCLGYGVVIPHYGTIVVNGDASVGNYAVLHTSTCIAGKKEIGDYFYFSTGSQIIGEITIGDGVTVAAHSLVNHSAENNKLLVGAPAVVKQDDYPTWVERDGEIFRKRSAAVKELLNKCTIV